MKLKSKKAAAKRFKFTATGKVKFKRAGKRHGLSNKRSSTIRKLRGPGILFDGDEQHIRDCLPYGTR